MRCLENPRRNLRCHRTEIKVNNCTETCAILSKNATVQYETICIRFTIHQVIKLLSVPLQRKPDIVVNFIVPRAFLITTKSSYPPVIFWFVLYHKEERKQFTIKRNVNNYSCTCYWEASLQKSTRKTTQDNEDNFLLQGIIPHQIIRMRFRAINFFKFSLRLVLVKFKPTKWKCYNVSEVLVLHVYVDALKSKSWHRQWVSPLSKRENTLKEDPTLKKCGICNLGKRNIVFCIYF